MKMTDLQLKALGYCESSPGVYARTNTIPPSGKDAVAACEINKSRVNQAHPKRIRQSSKPLMNKLEGRFFDTFGDAKHLVIPQSVTFRLANGVRYTPDFFSFSWFIENQARPTAWEVKGPWFTEDAKVKIKLFAAAYPQIRVILASEDHGEWNFQTVLP